MIGVVLAGKPECRLEAGGKLIAGWVAEALAGVPGMDRVAVVGAGAWPGAIAVEPGAGIVDNLRRGLEALSAGGGAGAAGRPAELIVAAGDAPLITAAAVERFAAACRAAGADLGYPVVPKAACLARFPGVRRTYVRVREGAFTGGNCFFLSPAAIAPAVDRLESVFAARKHPLQLARLLGAGLLLRFVFGRAAIADAERAADRILGVRARAIVCADDPELGVDVDRPADLELVRRHLAG